MSSEQTIILKRKVYDSLLEWKKCNGSKAIMIEGARRVGKSTIVEEFGNNEYRSYIIIDFSTASDAMLESFRKNRNDLDELFMRLSVEYRTKLYRRESLIVFDEVQKYPEAREMIKHLVEDGRYDYIETGSLISIRENVVNIIIPSEERKIKMHPLDFEEFCWAFGDTELVEYIRRCFESEKPLDKDLHLRAMSLFMQYMMVGGMPKSVVAYIGGDRDFVAADEEKKDILELYRDDIMKIPYSYGSKIQSIFDQIPSFLSKHEKRVILSKIAEGSTIDQYDRTFFWLGNSMICNECFSVNDPDTGLSLSEDRTSLKCYMGDTGLLMTHAFEDRGRVDPEIYRRILNGDLKINKGMLFENVIAQMLVANGHNLFFYTHYNGEKHRNDIEIDFIISGGNRSDQKMIPIEVKSSPRYKTVSLNRFQEKYADRIACSYVVHPAGLRKDGDTLYIPPYMVICL